MIEVLLAVHILLFAIALALTEGVSLFLQIAARIRSIDIGPLARLAVVMDRFGAACWLTCAATGLLLVYQMQMNWFQGWIIVSITLFIILAVNGIIGHSRWLGALALVSPAEISPQIARSKNIANLISIGVIPTIVLLMVMKPS